MPRLLDLLDDSARSTGRVRFVSTRAAEPQVVSFGDIWRQAGAFAAHLGSRVGGNGAVAMVLAPDPACLATLLGAWQAGLRVVSLPHRPRGLDPADYAEQITAMCRVAGAPVVFAEAELCRAHNDAAGEWIPYG